MVFRNDGISNLAYYYRTTLVDWSAIDQQFAEEQKRKREEEEQQVGLQSRATREGDDVM